MQAASLSARRAWIEIHHELASAPPVPVALRKESVDRNRSGHHTTRYRQMVALRKESVDRNHADLRLVAPLHVALRKESVDRNAYAMLNA